MQNQKSDFFNKNLAPKESFNSVIRHPEKKNNLSWILIILIIIILGMAFFYMYEKNIFNLNGWETAQVQELKYSIGDVVLKEGKLVADGDLVTYTHSLETSEGEKFLLKSKTVSLNNYSTDNQWIYQIEGKMEALYHNLPLIEVSLIGNNTIPLTTIEETPAEEQTPVNPWVYVAQAGILFLPDFFENYAFVGDAWKENKISVKNLDNDLVSTISFFSCTEQGDSNCKELKRTFEDNAEKKVSTSNGDIFYKLGEVKSWFFQNGNWRGYFINDAEEAEVEKIKNSIVLPNPEYLKDIVSQYGVKVCLGDKAWMSTTSDYKVRHTGSGLFITILGSGEKNFSCEVEVDLVQPQKLKFIDLKVSEIPVQVASWVAETTAISGQKLLTSEENTPSLEVKDEEAKVAPENAGPVLVVPSVKQFPTSSEKTMTYNSKRTGITMVFPSGNLSYATHAENEEVEGISCNYHTNIIVYKDKALLDTNPSVIIHECSVKKEFKASAENLLLREVDGVRFVIEVKNPEWFDFANAISIKGAV